MSLGRMRRAAATRAIAMINGNGIWRVGHPQHFPRRRVRRSTHMVQEVGLAEKTKEKWYNNRAKVIFSFQAFPPLGIYALLRSTAFTVPQKFMVVAGVSALIGLFIYSGLGKKMNQFVIGLFT